MQQVKGNTVLKCDRRIAYDSPDHLVPWGTRQDNSTNPWFNLKLYRLYSGADVRYSMRLNILDLGCAGGGFVRECIDDGHFAIGLEGSDFSERNKRAEWRSIPDNLFTCDITRNFDIYDRGKKSRMLFNVVTCWEVIEHISEKDLEKMAANVKRHLAKDGIWIMSVAPFDDIVNGVNLHQTVKPKKWWVKKFESMGFVVLEKHLKYFDGHFVRGGKEGSSFNLVVTLPKNTPPPVPKENFLMRLASKYRGSKVQKSLKLVVTGDR